jgi:hypothetical protein
MVNYKSNISSMETYKHSTTFKKSQDGFDGRSYKGWNECFDKHVIPLVVKCEKLQSEVDSLLTELSKLRGNR